MLLCLRLTLLEDLMEGHSAQAGEEHGLNEGRMARQLPNTCNRLHMPAPLPESPFQLHDDNF